VGVLRLISHLLRILCHRHIPLNRGGQSRFDSSCNPNERRSSFTRKTTKYVKRQFINRSTIGEDLSAGLVLGIQSVPSGLANGLLALVNPIYGLHAYMMGVFTGAFFTSSTFMSVQGTSAMALVVASVPQVTQGTYPIRRCLRWPSSPACSCCWPACSTSAPCSGLCPTR
jgi:hypothetical protein